MTQRMNLPQPTEPIHSANECWWPLCHIAPVFAKEQNHTSLSAGGSAGTAPKVHRDKHHTYKGAGNRRLLQEAGGRQVLGVTDALPVPLVASFWIGSSTWIHWHWWLSRISHDSVSLAWRLFSNINCASMKRMLEICCTLYWPESELSVLFWSPCHRTQTRGKWSIRKNDQMIKTIDGSICRRKVKEIRIVSSLKGKVILPSHEGLFLLRRICHFFSLPVWNPSFFF